MPKAKAAPLEQTLSDIDAIVKQMESGQISLAESVALFEKGTKLIQSCQKTLKEAEQTVSTLMNQQADSNDDNPSE